MTTTYSVTRNQVINAALRKQGWLDYRQTADAQKLTDMAESLNIMIKSWAKNGLKVWCVEELTLPLVASDRIYTIGPSGAQLTANRPLQIAEAFIRYNIASTTPTDIPMQRLSRQEYQMLGNKFTAGTPNSFYYDQTIPNGTLYLYLTPDAFNSSNNEVHLFSRRQISDMNSSSDTFDFPQEWYQALVWGLAAETAMDNQISTEVSDRIDAKAALFLSAVEDWDREEASVFFQPDMQRIGAMRA